MKKLIHFLYGLMLFTLLSCSQFSSLCSHPTDSFHSNFFRPTVVHESNTSTETSAINPSNLLSGPNQTAISIKWEQLNDVKYESKFNPEYQIDFMYPIFGKEVKKLNGKSVIIKGYMIPLDVKSNLYAVSKYNYAACFFCGAAGVESVISLKFKGRPRRFKTDEFCTIQGTFLLNNKDVNDFIFVMKDAVEIK